VIWLHCVSVGEMEAARPLVDALRERFPSYRVAISTTTVTGQQVARRAFAQEAALIFYFPIDWSWTVRRALNAVNPAAILLMETELWPNLLREAARRSIPVALVNGRISPKSFRRYQKIRGFMQRVLANVTLALMQSDQDAERICKLGLPPERSEVVGNMKFDSAKLPPIEDTVTSNLRTRFAFNGTQPIIVAASTHAPEEEIILNAFKRVRQSPAGKTARLVIAPRHPERFDAVTELVAASGFQWSRRTAAASDLDAASVIVILDSIGELRATHQVAQIAFMGGSFIPHGGQNMLEPAAQGVCVITGPYTHNFAAIMAALLAEEAVIQLPEMPRSEAPGPLAHWFIELLRDEERRKSIGIRAQNVCVRNRGATRRTVEAIAAWLESRPTIEHSASLPAVITAAK
ncbi:MAG TPA: 3-deoxy-D-manno-octulosonic acid transferase, partial [Pyrinomonadaceae bacterium]|nr:3-deoxy-D-manno-octulosonic acid transferase [Pyrinomonadaceae bacterium]